MGNKKLHNYRFDEDVYQEFTRIVLGTLGSNNVTAYFENHMKEVIEMNQETLDGDTVNIPDIGVYRTKSNAWKEHIKSNTIPGTVYTDDDLFHKGRNIYKPADITLGRMMKDLILQRIFTKITHGKGRGKYLCQDPDKVQEKIEEKMLYYPRDLMEKHGFNDNNDLVNWVVDEIVVKELEHIRGFDVQWILAEKIGWIDQGKLTTFCKDVLMMLDMRGLVKKRRESK